MKAPLPTSRRTVLAGTGAGLIVAVTSACSTGNDYVAPAAGFSVPEPSDPGKKPEDYPDLNDPDGGATQGEADPAALASLDDIPVGTAKAVKDADGKQLIISRISEKKVAAFSAICTHAGCPVKPAGESLDCPCHGSKFDYATGEVTNGPAKKPLPPFEVHVKSGNVLAGKKKKKA